MGIDPEAFAAIRPEPCPVHADERGALWKALRASQMGGTGKFGEIYLVTFRKNLPRGNHYHSETTEWFLALQGRIRCRMALPGTPHRREYILDERNPALLKIPPGVAHSLTPEGNDSSMILAYADREYDKDNPDSIPFEV